MIAELLIGATALALLKGRAHGVGALGRKKRTIWREIETAQHAGVDFEAAFDEADAKVLNSIARQFNFEKSPRTLKDGRVQSSAEQYFNTLRRTYQTIAGIGTTDLPFIKSVITNGNGDVILEYKDYGDKEEQLERAINWIADELPIRSTNDAYWHALAYIAKGGKFVWKTKSHNDHVLNFGVDSIFTSPHNKAAAERKLHANILGSEKRGAIYPADLVDRLWQKYSDTADYQDVADGVEQALLMIQNRKQALQEILQMYYAMHTQQEAPDDPEAVFDSVPEYAADTAMVDAMF